MVLLLLKSRLGSLKAEKSRALSLNLSCTLIAGNEVHSVTNQELMLFIENGANPVWKYLYEVVLNQKHWTEIEKVYTEGIK